MKTLLLYIPLIAKGVGVTLGAWVFSAFVSACVGMCLGVLSAQHMHYYSVKLVIKSYTFIAKGIPAYVQILIAYFFIPAYLGINILFFIRTQPPLSSLLKIPNLFV